MVKETLERLTGRTIEELEKDADVYKRQALRSGTEYLQNFM